MTIFKKIYATFLVTCLFFVASSVIVSNALAAPRMYFEPSTLNSSKDYDFQVYLQIDVEGQSAFGADATITLPDNDIAVKSVSSGGFFSDFNYAQSPGKLEIHGSFLGAGTGVTKSGLGTFAVITLNSNKDTGGGTLGYECGGGGANTDILDSNGNNILLCGSLGNLNVSYTTNGYAPPNTCGGTCGSNYNCTAPLFCLNGACRNPDCPNDFTCGCIATPTPTVTPAPTKKPTPKPTSEVVYLTPRPSIKPTVKASATPTSTSMLTSTATPASASQTQGGFGYLIWVAAATFALAIILMIFAL